MPVTRRGFLKFAGAGAGGTMVAPLAAFYTRLAHAEPKCAVGYGPLEPRLAANAQELTGTILGDLSKEAFLALPPGFNYRVLSMTCMPMSDGSLVPAGHDGMAAFDGPRNTVILVRNHELSTSLPTTYNYGVAGAPRYSNAALGGTTTLVIGPNRKVEKDFVSLAGTRTNCAGGPTPWGSWITCEETFSTTASDGATVRHGYTFEVKADPKVGIVQPVALTALGRFSHEAIAVDPFTGYIYETEDRSDSCFYRFVPDAPVRKAGDLADTSGKLYALKVKGPANFKLNTTNNSTQGGTPGLVEVGEVLDVEWVEIDNVDPDAEGSSGNVGAGEVGVRYQAQSKGAAVFYRGEGCWYGNGLVYFVATQAGPPAVGATNGRGNGQVWAYDPHKETLTLLVEAAADGVFLDEPDNVTVTPFGDLLLCEDSSDNFQYLVGVNPEGEIYQFAKNVLFSQVTEDPAKADFIGNEFAGACFSPDGRTLFVNIQTPGITFAIWGPWKRHRR